MFVKILFAVLFLVVKILRASSRRTTKSPPVPLPFEKHQRQLGTLSSHKRTNYLVDLLYIEAVELNIAKDCNQYNRIFQSMDLCQLMNLADDILNKGINQDPLM